MSRVKYGIKCLKYSVYDTVKSGRLVNIFRLQFLWKEVIAVIPL